MNARVKFLGHSVHQMLIVFPLGLFGASFAFDIAHLITGSWTYGIVAYWMIAAGIIGAVVAAAVGLFDWLAVPRGTRAKAIGVQHGLGNVVVTVLFIVSWMERFSTGATSTTAVATSAIGIAVALFTSWMGFELVERLGVGVDDGANADAPSSLGARRP